MLAPLIATLLQTEQPGTTARGSVDSSNHTPFSTTATVPAAIGFDRLRRRLTFAFGVTSNVTTVLAPAASAVFVKRPTCAPASMTTSPGRTPAAPARP